MWKQTHSSSKSSYLWITEPEIQAAKVSEEAETSEEDPVLESGNRAENDNVKLKTITMERRARALLCVLLEGASTSCCKQIYLIYDEDDYAQ